jgi:hypothetical protein
MTRVRYYACAVTLSSQKEMTAPLTLGAVEKPSRAMGAQVFDIGLFDPTAAERTLLPRVRDLDTFVRSVSWLRLNNMKVGTFTSGRPARTVFHQSTTPVPRSSNV